MTGKLADLRPSVQKFLDFAAETRPSWDRAELQGALTAAGNNRPGERSAGQHWAATCRAAVRLLADADATPRDLLAEVAGPLHREPPDSSPEAAAAAIAEAKQAAADAQAAGHASLAAGPGETR